MNEVGIYLNCDKAESVPVARHCIDYLLDKAINVALLSSQLPEENRTGVEHCTTDVFFDRPDCVVVLGGDGTLLSVARRAALYNMPLFGINVGKLGFLTEGEASNYEQLLDNLVQGDFYLEERMMLTCSILRQGHSPEHYLALNDILLKNTGFRMMSARARVGEAVMDDFRADGLIIATPTGSTAYSLAAGGPVVAPGTDIIIVNPICPHRLHDRAYIIGADKTILLEFPDNERGLVVSIDGQIVVPIEGTDRVVIERAAHTTHLIRLNGISFFDRLRKKLSDDVQCEGDRR